MRSSRRQYLSQAIDTDWQGHEDCWSDPKNVGIICRNWINDPYTIPWHYWLIRRIWFVWLNCIVRPAISYVDLASQVLIRDTQMKCSVPVHSFAYEECFQSALCYNSTQCVQYPKSYLLVPWARIMCLHTTTKGLGLYALPGLTNWLANLRAHYSNRWKGSPLVWPAG